MNCEQAVSIVYQVYPVYPILVSARREIKIGRDEGGTQYSIDHGRECKR